MVKKICNKNSSTRLMVKRGCADGVLDTTLYDKPVPVIGLYITTAALVCSLLMVSDILAAYRNKKRWLPCRLFSLNSMTITLLSIVAKLPMDLTSPMPSAPDQLGKLTSTTMICVSMGFLMPSIGVHRERDCFANLVALTIFVITVVVNICMQLYTGVIYLFTAEHIIVVCCMLGMLILLWFLRRAIEFQKRLFIDRQKDLIQKGEHSMLTRLKMCYLYGFNSNPQFIPCKDPHSATIGFLCMVSLVVVTQAVLRSLFMHEIKFCRGISNFGGTMWLILFAQFWAVIVGCSATSFRWLAMVNEMQGGYHKSKPKEQTYVNPILGILVRDMWKDLCEMSLLVGDFIMIMVVFIPATAVNQAVKTFYARCVRNNREETRPIAEFKDVLDGDKGLDEWTLRKSVGEMKNLMDASKSSLYHLSRLLSRTQPSQQYHTTDLRNELYLNEDIEVSMLSMVLLVRIASVSVPSALSGFLAPALDEVYDILHFINDRINFVSIKNKEKSKLAKLVWKGRDFSVLLPTIYAKTGTEMTESQPEMERALLILRELKHALPSDVLWEEVGFLTDLINRRSYSSIQDLYQSMEQLLVDMVHLFFTQLPIVIYNEVIESPPEDYEDRVRLCLRIIWKIEPVEGLVQWLFPPASKISQFMTNEAAPSQTQNNRLEDCTTSDSSRNDDVIVHVK